MFASSFFIPVITNVLVLAVHVNPIPTLSFSNSFVKS